MFSKPDLKIEKLGHDTLKVLDRVAAQNGVTREHQAISVLNAWASPAAVSANDKERIEVAQRLNFSLSQLQGVKGGRNLTASLLAEFAGLSGPESTIAALHGEAEIDFGLLDKLACVLGVDPEWLKHGRGVPYPAPEIRLSYAAEESIDQLLSPKNGEKVARIYFLRSNDKFGSLKIVRRFGSSFSCELLSTPYHISQEIGGGGEGDLSFLFRTFQCLYREYTGSASNPAYKGVVIKSYLLSNKYFQGGEAQHVHPLLLPEHGTECPWWEDIWDANSGAEHWEGYKEFKSRILNAMEFKGLI